MFRVLMEPAHTAVVEAVAILLQLSHDADKQTADYREHFPRPLRSLALG